MRANLIEGVPSRAAFIDENRGTAASFARLSPVSVLFSRTSFPSICYSYSPRKKLSCESVKHVPTPANTVPFREFQRASCAFLRRANRAGFPVPAFARPHLSRFEAGEPSHRPTRLHQGDLRLEFIDLERVSCSCSMLPSCIRLVSSHSGATHTPINQSIYQSLYRLRDN